MSSINQDFLKILLHLICNRAMINSNLINNICCSKKKVIDREETIKDIDITDKILRNNKKSDC